MRLLLALLWTVSWVVGHNTQVLFDEQCSSTMTCVKATAPPTIDVGPLVAFPDPRRQEAVRQIGEAARKWGFFHIVNHGIPDTLVAAFEEQMQHFFALPSPVKHEIKRQANNSRGFADDELTKQLRDVKEILDIGGPHESGRTTQDGTNQWPSADRLPLFRHTVEQYYDACAAVAARLLRAIAEDLDVDGDVFASAFANHSSFLRLNYYPVRQPQTAHNSGATQLGVSRHTDAGVLTLLLQDTHSALEVYSGTKEDNGDGAWVAVEPVAGALTVNTGDMLQVWSNDVYRAPEHRVRASVQHARFSAPFFYNPRYDAEIFPMLAQGGTLQERRYRRLSWGEFRLKRFQGDYADLGREVQIEDYRV